MATDIKRRDFLAGLAAQGTLRGHERPPNLLLIVSDDQGYQDVGCYGSEIPTPNIDSIARNGIKFTHFYAAAPVCTPSRYGLLTGRYPVRSKDRLMSPLTTDSKEGIRPGEFTVAEALRRQGYGTAIIGKWHLGNEAESLPTRHGFEYFDGFLPGAIDYFNFTYGGLKCWYRNERLHLPRAGYTTDYITDQALRFLRRKRKQPFFLYLPYNAPHFAKLAYDAVTKKFKNGLQAPEAYVGRFSHIADKDRRVYAATVANLDDNVGRLLIALRELKLEENTWVLFLSDNGASLNSGGKNGPLRGQKTELFEGGIRVPCVMQWKGRIPPGTVSSQVAGNVDFFPTVAALTRMVGRYQTDGVDLTTALFKGQTFDREMFWCTDGEEACLSGAWKYIRRGKNEEMIFNVQRDSGEQQNLSGDEARLAEMRKIFLRLRNELPQWR